MKKFKFVVLGLALVLTLSACNKNTNNTMQDGAGAIVDAPGTSMDKKSNKEKPSWVADSGLEDLAGIEKISSSMVSENIYEINYSGEEEKIITIVEDLKNKLAVVSVDSTSYNFYFLQGYLDKEETQYVYVRGYAGDLSLELSTHAK